MTILAIIFMTAFVSSTEAAAWIWLSSNDKYSKYFDPASVKVTHQKTTPRGDVATSIEAWTKTQYSYEGALETIRNYDIADVLPNPQQLDYSLARLRINPQNRTVMNLQETFYNADNQVVWSRGEGNEREVNSQNFDEDFYAAIVDTVFRQGEAARRKAPDRWITLYEDTFADGGHITVTADTTTMRMKDKNLIVWEWLKHTDRSGNVLEIKFMKKFVNLSKGTERVDVGKYWSPSTRWQDLADDMDGQYRMISENAAEYKGLERLRAFAKGYSTWVNRYSLQ